VFKHNLTREVAYETLPKARRRELHGMAVDWIERTAGDRVEESLELLAHHADQAGRSEQALEYLVRTADRAGRTAAPQEQATLLARAIRIAEQLGRAELLPSLRSRRGRALCNMGAPAEAREEFETVLLDLPDEEAAERAALMVELAGVWRWLGDTAALHKYASNALALAEQQGRDDLAAAALAAMASGESSQGRLAKSLELYRTAYDRTSEIRLPSLVQGLEQRQMILYWLGRSAEAIEAGTQAVRVAREVGDVTTVVRALSALGLAYGSNGRYADALQSFGEARQACEQHGLGIWLARTLAMAGGLHLDIGDLEEAEALAEQARAAGRVHRFEESLASSGIDLLFNYARRGELGATDALAEEVDAKVRRASGVHGWLWRMRFTQALAELHLARQEWEQAMHGASTAIERSRAHGRVKYEVLGLITRAQALAATGNQARALMDARAGAERAASVGDPALERRAFTALVMLGDGHAAPRADQAARRVGLALPEDLRRRLERQAE
ncbi:MAG: tetratricopeptide repeat protein, partial [Jiangellaceae bacterium]|nr:tetratricopeptide repeat protein [Jiangellaceae bacterium]